MTLTFTKRPGHLLNDLDIYQTTWTFTKQPGHLLNVLVDSGLDWTVDWTGLWTEPDCGLDSNRGGWTLTLRT